MSGFEVVGVVFGLLPLLISAGEHYEDVYQPFLRYRHFSKDVERFRSSLRTQKRIFLNTSQLLLQHITDNETAAQLLTSSTASNDGLEEALAVALGISGEECLEIIQSIQDTLQKIDDEKFLSLESDLKSKSPCPTDEAKMTAWRRRVVKARFSVSKARLEGYLQSLRDSNDEFRTLTSQMYDLVRPRSYAVSLSRPSTSKDVRKFKIIQQASRQLYNVLGRACTMHVDHTAHFCLEAEHTILSGKSIPQIVFSLALTHSTAIYPGLIGPPIWFEVQSTIESESESENSTAYLPKLKHVLQEQNEDENSHGKFKKAKKSVRFRSQLPSSSLAPTMSLPALSLSTRLDEKAKLPNLCKLGNLCTTIRASLTKSDSQRLASAPKKCIGLLEETEDYRQLVYPLIRDQNLASQSPTSLSDHIVTISKSNNTMALSSYEKVRLARRLATAILQYNSTPWLDGSWRSKDIYFFDVTMENPSDELPRLTAPHFSKKVSTVAPNNGLLDLCESEAQPYADNQILFGLGTVLLELGLEATLANLQKPTDADQMDIKHPTASSEFITAKRLAAGAMVSRKMGASYHRIMQKCLRCDFGCGSDLADMRLQERFYKEVVCELEVLEVKLRSISLDQ